MPAMPELCQMFAKPPLVGSMCCKTLHGASPRKGIFFGASSSQTAQEPIGIFFAARFWLRTNPGKIMQVFRARFAQDPRKHRARQPALDSRGTSASNHSCIKPAKASLALLSLKQGVCLHLFLSVHKPGTSHRNTPTKSYIAQPAAGHAT